MSGHALRSRNIDLEEDHTQFSGSKVDNSYREQEQFECPSTENLSVVHEHDGSEIHSPKVDRIQTPADRHGEKETSCEGDFNTGTVAEPASIVNTNAELQEILASVLQSVKQSVKEANEKLQKDIERSVKGEISKLKEEVCLENKRLIEQFEKENIKLSKGFDDKLHHESAKMGKIVQQVRDDNERELVAVKKKCSGSIYRTT
jgi:hypothetical protein